MSIEITDLPAPDAVQLFESLRLARGREIILSETDRRVVDVVEIKQTDGGCTIRILLREAL